MSLSTLDPNKVGIAVHCGVCHQRKKPFGRSQPLWMYLCDRDCLGYDAEPLPGSLWPGESEADFGYSVSDIGTEMRGEKTMAYKFPRRAHLDQMVPAEMAIHQAIAAVEEMGADSRLTDVVLRLSDAKDVLSDYVDAQTLPPEAFHQGTATTIADFIEHLRDDFVSTAEPVKKIAKMVRERFTVPRVGNEQASASGGTDTPHTLLQTTLGRKS